MNMVEPGTTKGTEHHSTEYIYIINKKEQSSDRTRYNERCLESKACEKSDCAGHLAARSHVLVFQGYKEVESGVRAEPG